MTATYSNDPAGRQIDEMRFLIDDKDTDNALLSDEEISYLIGSYRHLFTDRGDIREHAGIETGRRFTDFVWGGWRPDVV